MRNQEAGVIEMSANLSPNLDMNFAGAAAEPFSIALIGPDAEKRSAVAGALAQWPGAEVRQLLAPRDLFGSAGNLDVGNGVIVRLIELVKANQRENQYQREKQGDQELAD